MSRNPIRLENKLVKKNFPELSIASPSHAKYKVNEEKNIEKEIQFFKSIYPRIFPKIKSNESEKMVYNINKKINKIILSVRSFNNYMLDYRSQQKYPSSFYYSTENINNFIPFKLLSTTNLRKTYLNSTYHSDKPSCAIYKYSSIREKYGKIWEIKKNGYHMSDNEVFRYFADKTFLNDPSKFEYLNINEKNLYSIALGQNDFEFYEKFLQELSDNKNYTDSKSKEYEIIDLGNIKRNFYLDLQSICLSFEELAFQKTIKKSTIKRVKIQKIFLPFNYLPLIYLLSFSSLKSFISEIITYDYENNKFSIVVNESLNRTLKKYCEFCKIKIAQHNKQKDDDDNVFKNIIFNENEYHYNYYYDWIVFEYNSSNNKNRYFKLNIILPTINFKIKTLGMNFKMFASKRLILELIKSNFISWDRYLLYMLFMNKDFRNSITVMFNKSNSSLAFGYNLKMVGPTIDSNISKKNSFEFFITEISNEKNFYYFIVPYRATILANVQQKYELNDVVNLKLNDAKRIYKFAKHFGLNGIFNKCLFYEKYTKKYFFSFKYTQNIDPDYLLSNKKHKTFDVNKKCFNIFRYNGIEYHLVIRECLLCQHVINIHNHGEYKYFPIPDDLLKYVFEKDMNDEKTLKLIRYLAETIIESKEIEEYKEYSTKKNKNLDASSRLFRTKSKKKININESNNSSTKNFDKKNSEAYDKYMQLSNEMIRTRNSTHTIVFKGLAKPIKEGGNKGFNRSITKHFDFSIKNNIKNIYKNGYKVRKKTRLTTDIDSLNQLNLMRINRVSSLQSSINSIKGSVSIKSSLKDKK